METANRRMALQKMSGIPGYADGGLIDSFKRAVGMAPPETMREKFARQDAERAAKRPAPQVATEAPTKAISAYAGNTALDARMAANPDAKAAGGPITGKGGPKEDNIPIMASNGEFVIRAAAAKAIGLPALTALNKLGGDLPESPNTTDNKFEEGGLIDPNKKATDSYNSQLANANAQAATRTAPAGDQSPAGEVARTQSYLAANQRANDANPLFSMTRTQYGADNLAEKQRQASTQLANIYNPAPAPAAPLASPNASAMMQRQVGNAGTGDGSNTYQPKYPVKPLDQLAGVVPQVAAPSNSFGDAASWNSNRQPMSAQDQGAMNGIQARQNASDGAMAAKMQYDQEVKDAQAINAAGRKMNLEYAASNGNVNERKAALAILSSMSSESTAKMGDQTTRRGQDLTAQTTQRGQDVTERTTSRGQDIQANDSTQRNGIARDRLSMDSQGAALDNASKSKLMAAQDKLANATTDDEIEAATKTVRALTGKFGKEAQPVRQLVVPGGQAIDANGQAYTQAASVFDPDTKSFIKQGEAQKPVSAPKAGEVRNGFKFNGGNPNDKANWVKNG